MFARGTVTSCYNRGMANNSESMESGETVKGGPAPNVTTYLTLAKAIEFGEYNPDYLANFPEWHKLNRHSQFELIKKALENRHRQLWLQWTDINNVIDFSKKPHLQKALVNIQKQIKQVEADREDLIVEYSSG